MTRKIIKQYTSNLEANIEESNKRIKRYENFQYTSDWERERLILAEELYKSNIMKLIEAAPKYYQNNEKGTMNTIIKTIVY